MESSSSAKSQPSNPAQLTLDSCSSDTGATESPEVYAGQVRLLYADAYTGLVVSLFNAVVLTYIQFEHAAARSALLWLGSMTVVILCRIALVASYHRRPGSLENTGSWSLRYLLGAAATGIGWGCAGVIFVPSSSVPHQFFTTFVLAGVAAAAMTVLSPVYRVYVAYLLPTLTPVMIRFLFEGDRLHLTASLLILFYLLFLLKAGKKQSQFVQRSLCLALEKTELIHHLAEQNQHVRSLNENLHHEISERKQTERSLELRLEFESLLTAISTRFINLPTDGIDAGMMSALQQLAEFSRVDHGMLALFSDDRSSIGPVYEYHSEGTQAMGPMVQGLDWRQLPLWRSSIEKLETLHVAEARDLPPESASEKALLVSNEIRSLIAVPLASGSLPVGFLAFASRTAPMFWDRKTSTLLRIVAEMLLSALQRKQGQLELEKAQHAAEAAAKAKASFLANMSHEIRTPIHGALGMLSLLKQSSLGPTERQYAEMAHRSGEMLLGIIDDILDFSRIEAGKLKLDAVEFDLREVVEEAALLAAERAESKGLTLNCRVHNDAPQRCVGDPLRLRQVLINLVDNGVKFTDSGAVELLVSVERQDAARAALLFQIRDTGIGIPHEALETLFEPFTQADDSSTRRYGGAGLGLAVSKQLIDLMGGGITVDSSPDAGSTFHLRLSLPVAPSASIARSQALRGARLLLIENEPLLRATLAHYLDGWKTHYSTTGSAEQALHSIQKAAESGVPYALIIIGKQTTGISAQQLAKSLVGNESFIAPRIILLSPSNTIHLHEDLHGDLTLLTCPVQHTALFNAMVECLADTTTGTATRRSPVSGNAERAASDEATFRGRRILLVEDNLVNQQVAFEMLTAMGLEVSIAANGQEAVEKYQADHFDLIFMDCQMPLMDGLQATRLIRTHERYHADRVTPIIALTASAMIGDREKCIGAGMNDYLAKPFRRADLREMLTRWMA